MIDGGGVVGVIMEVFILDRIGIIWVSKGDLKVC